MPIFPWDEGGGLLDAQRTSLAPVTLLVGRAARLVLTRTPVRVLGLRGIIEGPDGSQYGVIHRLLAGRDGRMVALPRVEVEHLPDGVRILPWVDRVDDIVPRLNITEKIGLLSPHDPSEQAMARSDGIAHCTSSCTRH